MVMPSQPVRLAISITVGLVAMVPGVADPGDTMPTAFRVPLVLLGVARPAGIVRWMGRPRGRGET
jgi:hypothetical protein